MMSTRANTGNKYIHADAYISIFGYCTTSYYGSLLTHYRIHGTQRSITLVEEAKA